MSPTDTKSEKSSLTMLTGFSAGTKGWYLDHILMYHCHCRGEKALTLMSVIVGEISNAGKVKDRTLRSPEAFVSIQLEKIPFRDLMLNEFLDKKKSMGMMLRNPEEMDKLRR